MVPENIREKVGKANVRRNIDGSIPTVTWIIEVSSQVIFSTTATVHYELVVGRDEKSTELGFAGLTGTVHTTPGQLHDHQQGKRSKDGHSAAQPKGLYSRAVKLIVDDTASLWNKPSLSDWEESSKGAGHDREPAEPGQDLATTEPDRIRFQQYEADGVVKLRARRRKKVHLVILTHGLHSNLGADMLYLKESIDTASKQARIDSRRRRQRKQSQAPAIPPIDSLSADKSKTHTELKSPGRGTSTAPLSGGQKELDEEIDFSEDEEVIVRGFSGNTVRTERGIQYLGKRLAKYVLSMTYPDQPYLPAKKSVTKSISRALTGQEPQDVHTGLPSHDHSSIHKETVMTSNMAYQITSISFIGHSLGGLTQTYAIAYIHKHSPHFFEKIKPINFVALATPFLGLSNENPIYVKFALDFGVVGRTGQDLGLTWRPPTMVRSGWGAMIAGIGTEGQRAHRQLDPGSKPLLRILPSGPAHHVLKMFRNRTVYSNVVNDGIVPLRTSCLLFLDWRGLGRVEKARRENGLVGTMAGWGWAELTGSNASAPKTPRAWFDGENSSQADYSEDEGANTPTRQGDGDTVPQPPEDATKDDNAGDEPKEPKPHQFLGIPPQRQTNVEGGSSSSRSKSQAQPSSPFAGFLSLLRPGHAKGSPQLSPKNKKIYSRSQTTDNTLEDGSNQDAKDRDRSRSPSRPGAIRGGSLYEEPDNVFTPPKTSVFEAAGDILNPPIPNESFLTDPTKRPRTIFHDRIYHPDDIPDPPARQRSAIRRTLSGNTKDILSPSSKDSGSESINSGGSSGMKVEEKIARAYHRDLTWRKVLVRLEPDAHNNIVVRRMFSNAYGWPVIKHLVDTHFADTYAATTADKFEPAEERAKPVGEAVGEHGTEVKDQLDGPTPSQSFEEEDHLEQLKSPTDSLLSNNSKMPRIVREDSAQWDDRFFEGTDDDDDDDYEAAMLPRSPRPERQMPMHGKSPPELDDGVDDAMSVTHTRKQKQMDRRRSSASSKSGSKPSRIVVPMPTSPSKSTTNELGLRKSLEEQLSTSKGSIGYTLEEREVRRD